MTDSSRILEIEEISDFAESLARAAGAVTLRYFGAVVDAERKSDGTPVTVADREAESLMRRRIRERFPDHGILGEEFGEDLPDASTRWILDPIDGTKSFMRGIPLYGVLIGVERGGEPVVGVAHFPALQ
jgi:fructose-1,6-bisphosphatase/inositol monophosphatase family enzyme